MRVVLTHTPTGVSVEGAIEEGSYTRAEMRQLGLDLRARLLLELERRVARHLRIPAR
jgi:hypothetical protein